MIYARSFKVRIIVVFGDIAGFTGFYDSVTNDEKELIPFLDEFDELVDTAQKKARYEFTDTGDGFMCLVDVNHQEQKGKIVTNLLKHFWELWKSISQLIEEKEPPKPEGFRIRLACGYVLRKIKKNGVVIHRGRHINMAHNLLDAAKGVGVLCHDSFKQLLTEKQIEENNFVFKRISPPKKGFNSVTPKDASSLWSFEIKE